MDMGYAYQRRNEVRRKCPCSPVSACPLLNRLFYGGNCSPRNSTLLVDSTPRSQQKNPTQQQNSRQQMETAQQDFQGLSPAVFFTTVKIVRPKTKRTVLRLVGQIQQKSVLPQIRCQGWRVLEIILWVPLEKGQYQIRFAA